MLAQTKSSHELSQINLQNSWLPKTNEALPQIDKAWIIMAPFAGS
jgi:hypothetical protein